MTYSTKQQKAIRVIADCDHLDSGLRDGDPCVIETVREMLVGLVTISSADQLRVFLKVVSVVAAVSTGPGVKDACHKEPDADDDPYDEACSFLDEEREPGGD